jgi:hypothetical protein
MGLFSSNTNPPKNQKPDFNEELKKDFSLKILILVLACGVTAILFVSLFSAFKGDTMKGFFPVLGLSLGIGFAATMSGGFLGFLFGIPKSLQRNQVASTSTVDPVTGKAATPSNTNRIFISNTNLEEISDWLTKIIVGVSLIQLTKIIKYYGDSCRSLARSFKGYLTLDFGFTYSGSLIIFFSVCGFLIVYLWARLYFIRQLNTLEDLFNSVVNRAINTQDKKIEKVKLERMIDDFNKERNKVTVRESTEDVKYIIETAKPGPVTVFNDCQKNRWGSSATNGAYSLKATVLQDATDPELFHVTATVTTTDITGSPVNGNVYFMLHDSYFPNSIITAAAIENKTAYCSFDSYEAFTLGAIINGGLVKLELDLNQDPAVPADYKYMDKLETIDEIKAKLAEINAEEN